MKLLYNKETFGMAQHKDWKKGKTASLTLSRGKIIHLPSIHHFYTSFFVGIKQIRYILLINSEVVDVLLPLGRARLATGSGLKTT